MKRAKTIVTIIFMLMLIGCSSESNIAYVRGDSLYFNDVKYDYSDGVYDVEDEPFARTDEGGDVYAIVGDENYNYLFTHNFDSGEFYKRESFKPMHTAIEGVGFGYRIPPNGYMDDSELLELIRGLIKKPQNSKLGDYDPNSMVGVSRYFNIVLKYTDDPIGYNLGEIIMHDGNFYIALYSSNGKSISLSQEEFAVLNKYSYEFYKEYFDEN